jgi:hypothetical protein
MKKSDESEPTPESPEVPFDPKLEGRKRLLARMAGNIAAGLISSPSRLIKDAQSVAEIAVDVAEAILTKIGL